MQCLGKVDPFSRWDLNQWVLAGYSGLGSVPDLGIYLIPRKMGIWWLRGILESGPYLIMFR